MCVANRHAQKNGKFVHVVLICTKYPKYCARYTNRHMKQHLFVHEGNKNEQPPPSRFICLTRDRKQSRIESLQCQLLFVDNIYNYSLLLWELIIPFNSPISLEKSFFLKLEIMTFSVSGDQ